MRALQLKFLSLGLILPLCVLLTVTSGCSRKATFASLTANAAQKEGMLGMSLEKFRKDISWGSVSSASQYVENSSKFAFGKILSRRLEREKIVEVKVQNVLFQKDSNEAEVILHTQFFKKPSLYVDNRFEKQLWAYNRLEGGWLLRNSKIVKEEQLKKYEELEEAEQSF